MRSHKLEIYGQENIKLIFILRWLLLYSCVMIRKARERVEKRREAVCIRTTRFGDNAFTRFVKRNESPLGSAGNSARNIEPCGKFGPAGDKERLYLRQLFFYRVYKNV